MRRRKWVVWALLALAFVLALAAQASGDWEERGWSGYSPISPLPTRTVNLEWGNQWVTWGPESDELGPMCVLAER